MSDLPLLSQPAVEPAKKRSNETVVEAAATAAGTLADPPPSETDFSVDAQAASTADPTHTVDYGSAARAEAESTPTADPTQTVNYQSVPHIEDTVPTPDPSQTVDYTSVDTPASREQSQARAAHKCIAGYEILGVLGRGAMGVVFKALQPGLKRLVALKMIRGGVHASEGELARFRVEAEAVAQLQHPNIVQIYEVGEDAGLPFFSLEYIEGTSLAKRIDGVPLPAAQAAELLLQLAHGIGYAHQKGVIHRDLKPANVLLTQDGVAKITDFGLAKKLEDESGQTHSGTVLGTPSYMPPEQAEGKLHDVGPLSDVYALGAVLYELLTGRPPFRGTTFLDTLHLVRTQEPVTPTELNPKVPRDLETICLKCLQKDRARRYSSADALAEDLRRFLVGEPILARPVGMVERAWRWCRRNPRVAGLSAAVVLLLIVWAATSSILAVIAQRNKEMAEENEQQMIAEAARADAEAKAAVANAQMAKKNEVVARTRQQHAFEKMVGLGSEIQKRLRSRRLSEQLGSEARFMRQQLMDVLRRKMLELAREIEEADVSPFSREAMYQQLGDLLKNLGQGKEALRQYEEGYKLAQKVAEERPDSDQARGNLAIMRMRLGDIALELNGDARTARDHYQKGWDLQQEISVHPRGRDFPEKLKPIVLSHHAVHLGRAYLHLGHSAEALKHFQEGLKLRQQWADLVAHSAESRSYLAEVYMWLGAAAWRRDDAKTATQSFRESIRLCETLIKESPRDFSFQRDLAEILEAWGDAQLHLSRPEEARTSFQKALDALNIVLARDPNDPSPQPLLALLHERLGGCAQRGGQNKEAEQHYREALKIREDLVSLEPDNRLWQAAYALTLARGGKAAQATRFVNSLRSQAAHSPDLLLQMARCHAVCAATAPQNQAHVHAALEMMQALAALDYRDAVLLRTDPDLVALRDEPAFRSIMDKME